MLQVISQLPFTMAMGAALFAAGVWTETHKGVWSPSRFRDYGFAPLQLLQGPWTRITTSVFLTAGRSHFYASFVMTLVGIGISELFWGTWPTMVLFWGVHFATVLIVSLVVAIPLHLMGVYRGVLLATAHDVGPSAGYYGCWGAVCNSLAHDGRLVLICAILVALATRLLWSLVRVVDHGRALSSDLSHLVAFVLGLLATDMLVPSVL